MNSGSKQIKQSLERIFPLEPYDIQLSLASAIYREIEKQTKMLIVESPTGTGKTYSLLVGTCKWLHDNPYKAKTPEKQKSVQSSLPAWLNNTNDKSVMIAQKEKQDLQELITIQEAKEQLQKQKVLKAKERLANPKQASKKHSEQKFEQFFEDFLQEQEQQAQNQRRKPNTFNPYLYIEEQSADLAPKIVFVSRTHSQLKQVMNSFNKLKGEMQLRCLSFASKDFLCINEKVNSKQGRNANSVHEKCQFLLSHGGCDKFHKHKIKDFFNLELQQSFQLGKQHNLCPYYALKGVMQTANIICVPYISILQPVIRSRLGIDLRNSIIIFDEAHNVIEYELATLSPEITYSELCILSSRINDYLQKYQKKMKAVSIGIIKHMLLISGKLMTLLKKQYQANLNLAQQAKNQCYRRTDPLNLFLQMELLEIRAERIKNFIQMTNFDNKLVYFDQKKPFSSKILYSFLDFLVKITDSTLKKSQILIKSNSQQGKNQLQLKNYSLKFLTLSSRELNRMVKQARIAIFAGGTMYPIDQFSSLRKQFKHKLLTYSHTISKQQCRVYCVHFFNKEKILFNHFNFKNHVDRQVAIIQLSLEKVLAKLHDKYGNSPAGLVVFVQNYNLVEHLGKKLNKQKFPELIFDSKNKKEDPLKNYEEKLKAHSRSILFSVMGGSLSEGINFSDQLARAVIVFGLPYANIKSPEIIQKMKFYDEEYKACFQGDILDIDQNDFKEDKSVTGQQYYENLCMRNINQTIGRGIRHSKDQCDIYLVDCRFYRSREKLSNWLQQRVQFCENVQGL